MTYQDSQETRRVSGVILVATLIAALIVTIGLDMMRDHTLQAPYPVNGERPTYPAIRDAQYSRACDVFKVYADGDAFAYCSSDRRVYRWRPDQQRWTSINPTR